MQLTGEVDPEVDDEDTEEEIDALVKELYFILTTSCQASAAVQQSFLVEYYPTVWHILPLYEEFMSKWHEYAKDPEMVALHPQPGDRKP